MRRGTKRAALAGIAAGAVALLRPGTAAAGAAARAVDRARRQLRRAVGRLDGVSYRLRGRHPDPDVADDVLADRVRSSLGGVQRRLDLPHIHVMVQDHVALLHGTVDRVEDADEIEQAVAAVSGVMGVESYLHIGLGEGDTRPSAGRAQRPASEARKRLLEAAAAAGIDPADAGHVVRAVLATFAERLPAAERDQVATHLPEDARVMFTPPRRTPGGTPPRTVPELVQQVAALTPALPQAQADEVVAAILAALRDLVPEERSDVAAVLPAALRDLWQRDGTRHAQPTG